MTIPVICKLNHEISRYKLKLDGSNPNWGETIPEKIIKVSGTLEIVWDYKTGDPTDIAGFDLEIETEGYVIHAISGAKSSGDSAIQEAIETILEETLLELAGEHCEIEPPDDLEDSIEYQKGLDDFYPAMPRG